MRDDEIKNLIKKDRTDILEKVDISINKRMQHLKPSAETINLIKTVELQIELMKKDIKNTNDKIVQLVVDNKEQHKEILDEIKNISSSKADKEEVNRLELFIGKVLWVSIIAIIGFLVEIIWFFINKGV
jgi:hypothetical protein